MTAHKEIPERLLEYICHVMEEYKRRVPDTVYAHHKRDIGYVVIEAQPPGENDFSYLYDNDLDVIIETIVDGHYQVYDKYFVSNTHTQIVDYYRPLLAAGTHYIMQSNNGLMFVFMRTDCSESLKQHTVNKLGLKMIRKESKQTELRRSIKASLISAGLVAENSEPTEQAYLAIEQVLRKHDDSLPHVWCNIQDGNFSNSWVPSQQHWNTPIEELISHTEEPDMRVWKLLRYECVSDTDFQFNKLMRLR